MLAIQISIRIGHVLAIANGKHALYSEHTVWTHVYYRYISGHVLY